MTKEVKTIYKRLMFGGVANINLGSKRLRTIAIMSGISLMWPIEDNTDYHTVQWPEGCFVLQRLVVCLEESIYIHNIKDMKLLKTLLNTPFNPSGKT